MISTQETGIRIQPTVRDRSPLKEIHLTSSTKTAEGRLGSLFHGATIKDNVINININVGPIIFICLSFDKNQRRCQVLSFLINSNSHFQRNVNSVRCHENVN